MVNVIVSVDANTFFSVEKLWENHGKPMLIMMIMLITMGKTHYEYYEIVISFQLSEKCHWWAIIVSQHSEAFNFSNDVCSMSLLYFFRNLMPSGNQAWLAGFFL